MTTTSRFEELTKQPEARLIKIYNHGDKYDNKAHNILVSPRIVHNFDQFVDEVNEKLKPPRAPLRKIYTSQVPYMWPEEITDELGAPFVFFFVQDEGKCERFAFRFEPKKI
jgi:hypothetical protein